MEALENTQKKLIDYEDIPWMITKLNVQIGSHKEADNINLWLH